MMPMDSAPKTNVRASNDGPRPIMGRESEWRVAIRALEECWSGYSRLLLFKIEERGSVFVDEFQHTPAAARHAGEWVFGDDHRQAGFFLQEFVDVAE
jgi:hypothetical protein